MIIILITALSVSPVLQYSDLLNQIRSYYIFFSSMSMQSKVTH